MHFDVAVAVAAQFGQRVEVFGDVFLGRVKERVLRRATAAPSRDTLSLHGKRRCAPQRLVMIGNA